MNQLTIIGNLVREPELTETAGGTPVCRMTVAVNRRHGAEGTDYFNVTAWRGLAETCAKYLRKGKKVCVVGSIQFRNYEDREGIKRTAADVMAQEVEFLSSGTESGEPPKRPQKQATAQQRMEEVDEDLPF